MPSMWQKISNPLALIFLEASYPETIRRRHLDWTIAEYQEQQHRLEHARQHADLVLQTDAMTVDQVLQAVLDYLRKSGV